MDFKKLDKTEFETITIYLKPPTGTKKPSIKVSKNQKKDLPFFDIEYEIRSSQSEEPIKFNLDEFESEKFFRGISHRILKDHLYNGHFDIVNNEVEKYIKVNWLSVYRNSESLVNNSEEIKNLPAIDIKISQLNTSLVKYFSMLAKKYADHIVDFQKQTLLSVLTPESENAILAFSNQIDMDHERRSLAAIFEVLGLDDSKFRNKINTHFEKFNRAIDYQKKNNGVSTQHFVSIINVWRSHGLVVEYENLQKRKQEIFEKQQRFISLLNSLFDGRKKVELSERNELVFKTSNNRILALTELSSGEKQLLIILGQALLQHEQPTIYIADEPELSLHLKWQEALTNAISSLNPNAQIVFATHSPDIVSIHQNNIINMEDCFK